MDRTISALPLGLPPEEYNATIEAMSASGNYASMPLHPNEEYLKRIGRSLRYPYNWIVAQPPHPPRSPADISVPSLEIVVLPSTILAEYTIGYLKPDEPRSRRTHFPRPMAIPRFTMDMAQVEEERWKEFADEFNGLIWPAMVQDYGQSKKPVDIKYWVGTSDQDSCLCLSQFSANSTIPFPHPFRSISPTRTK